MRAGWAAFIAHIHTRLTPVLHHPTLRVVCITSGSPLSYGCSTARAAALRAGEGGRLKTGPWKGCPYNTAANNPAGLPMDNPHGLDPATMFFAGSTRMNVVPPAIALQVRCGSAPLVDCGARTSPRLGAQAGPACVGLRMGGAMP